MMELLPPMFVYVGVVLVSLLIVLLVMRWLAAKFGAGRPGYLYCFLALLLPYFVGGVLLAGIFIGLMMLELDEPLMYAAGGLVALLVAFIVFVQVLDTTFLRGLGIAICTTVVSGGLGAALTYGVAISGVGGASLEGVTALLEDPDELVDEAMQLAKSVGLPVRREPRVSIPLTEVAKLKRAVGELCDCTDTGAPCREEMAALNPIMESIDPDRLPKAQADVVFSLQIRGSQCLADALSVARAVSSGKAVTEAPQPARPVAHSAATVSLGSDSERASNAGQTVAMAVANAYSKAGKSGEYGYREVDARRLDDHVGKLVRVTMTDGEERADVLHEITAMVLVLRQDQTQGGRTYELALDGVERVRVLARW